jgi:hypothetical protein
VVTGWIRSSTPGAEVAGIAFDTGVSQDYHAVAIETGECASTV